MKVGVNSDVRPIDLATYIQQARLKEYFYSKDVLKSSTFILLQSSSV